MKLRILLIISGVFAAFLLAEITLRLVAQVAPQQKQFRYIWSQRFLERRASGAASGVPDLHVTLRAMYGDKVDFTATSDTNNFGFIDHRPYRLDATRPVRSPFSIEHYHEYDHHFIEAGYRSLAACLETVVLRPLIESTEQKTVAK